MKNFVINSTLRLYKILAELATGLPFLSITIFGNSIILAFAYVMYYFEAGQNPKVLTYLDAVWWSFATATTVGYGDITPITVEGRILGILLMVIGTALFATYTALFARAILEDDIMKFRITQKKSRIEHEHYLNHLKEHQKFIERQIKDFENDKES